MEDNLRTVIPLLMYHTRFNHKILYIKRFLRSDKNLSREIFQDRCLDLATATPSEQKMIMSQGIHQLSRYMYDT